MKNLQDYFYYTRSERGGVLALCLLCVACFTLPYLFKTKNQMASQDVRPQFAVLTTKENLNIENTNTTGTTTLFEFNPNRIMKEDWVALGLSPKLAQTIVNYRSKGGQFRRKEDLLKIYGMKESDYERLEPYIQLDSAEKTHFVSKESNRKKSARLFSFDPNTATETDFVTLGLSEKTASTILKYRSKGGTFRQKEDLKKIYSLKEKEYERLASYISIEVKPVVTNQKPTTAYEFKPTEAKTYTPKRVVIDINQSTSEEWQTVRGIGPAYAKRIVNFREKLGGFNNVEQVKETFGLPDSTFQQIKSQLKESPVLRSISINTATVAELNAHPYVDARQAAAIVSYREQHGAFRSLEDLQQLKGLPINWLEKMQSYIRFD